MLGSPIKLRPGERHVSDRCQRHDVAPNFTTVRCSTYSGSVIGQGFNRNIWTIMSLRHRQPLLPFVVLFLAGLLTACVGSYNVPPGENRNPTQGAGSAAEGAQTSSSGSQQHELAARLSPDLAVTSPRCPPATVFVSTTQELHQAVNNAQPGDSIHLAAGTYQGPLKIQRSGTADLPIWLCGPTAINTLAEIRNDQAPRKYVIHLMSVSYWRLSDLHVTHGLKGIMLDEAHRNSVNRCTIHSIGHEGIHFRKNSTHNTIQDSFLSHTGLEKRQFGEGVYVGSAVSNWCRYTACQADRSNHNRILRNVMSKIGSEGVDIKEGVEQTLVYHNHLDMQPDPGDTRGPLPHDANSAMDVKGNHNTLIGNHIANPPRHAFQSRPKQDAPGSPYGRGNLFHNNRVVGSPATPKGRAFDARPDQPPIVTCGNVAGPLAFGVSNCVTPSPR